MDADRTISVRTIQKRLVEAKSVLPTLYHAQRAAIEPLLTEDLPLLLEMLEAMEGAKEASKHDSTRKIGRRRGVRGGMPIGEDPAGAGE